MSKQYSQTKALLAIVKANIIASFRSPYSLLLGLLFPIIFIVAFSVASSHFIRLNIAITTDSDTSSMMYKKLSAIEYLHLQSITGIADTRMALQQGEIIAVLNIKKNDTTASTPYTINIISSKAVEEKFRLFEIVLQNIIAQMNEIIFLENKTAVALQKNMIQDKPYKSVDFILPGQLGFSLLTMGIMGVAFSMFHLREALVLKRFRATPIKKINILLGEAMGRILFQLSTISILIFGGKYFFDFTLENGFISYIEMIILCFIGLLIFMGMGFGISGIVKNSNTIPILGNMLMFPQLILSGTFFSIDIFPQWLKIISYSLPLTSLNDALRKIAFDGLHLWQVFPQLGALIVWVVIIYFFATKTFKWE